VYMLICDDVGRSTLGYLLLFLLYCHLAIFLGECEA
jgi:hypothetical protein